MVHMQHLKTSSRTAALRSACQRGFQWEARRPIIGAGTQEVPLHYGSMREHGKILNQSFVLQPAEEHCLLKLKRNRGSLPQCPQDKESRGIWRYCCQVVWGHSRRAKRSATTITATIQNNSKPSGNTKFWNKPNHLYFIVSRSIWSTWNTFESHGRDSKVLCTVYLKSRKFSAGRDLKNDMSPGFRCPRGGTGHVSSRAWTRLFSSRPLLRHCTGTTIGLQLFYSEVLENRKVKWKAFPFLFPVGITHCENQQDEWSVSSCTREKHKPSFSTHCDLMIPHHIIKLLINFFIFFFCMWREHIGSVRVWAVAPSVFLLVQSLNNEVNKKDQHIKSRGEVKVLTGPRLKIKSLSSFSLLNLSSESGLCSK